MLNNLPYLFFLFVFLKLVNRALKKEFLSPAVTDNTVFLFYDGVKLGVRLL